MSGTGGEMNNAQLCRQVALLRWLSSGSDQDRAALAAVTGLQVGRELLNRITGQDQVEAYKRECILAVSQFVQQNPSASAQQLQDQVLDRVLVFASRVRALEEKSLF